MKAFVYIGIIGASALLLAFRKGKSRLMEMSVPSISVSTSIMRDTALTRKYPRYLSSQLKVGLAARVNGRLRTSYLEAGGRMKKDDLIFMIEPDTYQDDVTQTETSVETSKAQLEYARSNYERMKGTTKSGAVSQIQVTQAEATVSESETAVRNAEAELDTARTNLNYCCIRVPFNGAVTRASYDIGNYINGTVQPVTLATLYKDDLMFASSNVEDNQFMKVILEVTRNDSTVKLPTEILVSIGKNGGNAYTGRLDYLSPSIDLSTGTPNIRTNLDNPKHVLKSSLYVTITLPYAEQPNTILVRGASISTDQLGKCLYIMNDSSVVRCRPVEMGQLVDDMLRQVTAGISPKDSCVTSALLKVRDGMTIKPIR